jgi:hypothetical protein
MKKLFLLLSVAFLVSCSSNSDNKINNPNTGKDSLTTDLNTKITKTIFDSLPVERLPYTDSICIENSKPLRQIIISNKNLEFLKFRNTREFREYYWPQPDSAFSLVCRLKLSPNFYSLIFNYDAENETMNYLINYDSNFKVIDYIQTSYDETVESALRITSIIDLNSLIITSSNFMNEPESQQIFNYSITPEGYFREHTEKQVASIK